MDSEQVKCATLGFSHVLQLARFRATWWAESFCILAHCPDPTYALIEIDYSLKCGELFNRKCAGTKNTRLENDIYMKVLFSAKLFDAHLDGVLEQNWCASGLRLYLKFRSWLRSWLRSWIRWFMYLLLLSTQIVRVKTQLSTGRGVDWRAFSSTALTHCRFFLAISVLRRIMIVFSLPVDSTTSASFCESPHAFWGVISVWKQLHTLDIEMIARSGEHPENASWVHR